MFGVLIVVLDVTIDEGTLANSVVSQQYDFGLEYPVSRALVCGEPRVHITNFEIEPIHFNR